MKASKISPESLQTDLDRYRQATKRLRNLIKGMDSEGKREIIKDFDYDLVRARQIRKSELSADEELLLRNIKEQKDLIEQYEKGAKKIAREILEKDRRSVTATKRTGLLGPHLANDTSQAVKSELDKPQEEQIKDIKNWFIFDIPTSSTGQGTRFDNPLIKQNDERERIMKEVE